MCQNCEYEDYIEKCDELLEDDRMGWCSDTVDRIKNWIEEHKHITERQQDTINKYHAIWEDKYG